MDEAVVVGGSLPAAQLLQPPLLAGTARVVGEGPHKRLRKEAGCGLLWGYGWLCEFQARHGDTVRARLT